MKFDAKDYPLLQDLENLKERNHSMLLYDNEEYAKLVKYHYIGIGLKKGEHSIILTHDDVNSIENEAASCGIDVDNFKRKKLLHIHRIENVTEQQGEIPEFKDLLRQIAVDLKPPFRFIGRVIPDVSTEVGMQLELDIEHKFHSEWENHDCSFLCTYAINDIEESKRSMWLSKLLENHHHLIYATDPVNSVSFEPNLLETFRD
ncbi:MAG: MEDS domain-containing protein [Nitrosopumilus sp.]|nr:MEDS domain-containing protein [Nitrosopumilus sp.]MDH3384951.1 MEDS domain-containing protein [Nitrosopumilus sp.]